MPYLLGIGEFAQATHLSIKTLRRYHEAGLLEPAHVDRRTGYRYYSAKQLPELNRILALKELGLTLDQIAYLIEGRISINEIRGMLVLKKAQIEQTLREELARVHYIESRISQIDQGNPVDYPVVLKSIPTQKLIAVREPSITLATLRTAGPEIGRALAERVGGKTLGHFALIFHSGLWDSDDLDVEIGFLLKNEVTTELALPNGRLMQVHDLPAVDMMATAVHTGIPETGHRVYGALGLWAEANGYHFASPSREIFIRLPRSRSSDDLVVEIQVPVQPVSSER